MSITIGKMLHVSLMSFVHIGDLQDILFKPLPLLKGHDVPLSGADALMIKRFKKMEPTKKAEEEKKKAELVSEIKKLERTLLRAPAPDLEKKQVNKLEVLLKELQRSAFVQLMDTALAACPHVKDGDKSLHFDTYIKNADEWFKANEERLKVKGDKLNLDEAVGVFCIVEDAVILNGISGTLKDDGIFQSNYPELYRQKLISRRTKEAADLLSGKVPEALSRVFEQREVSEAVDLQHILYDVWLAYRRSAIGDARWGQSWKLMKADWDACIPTKDAMPK